jgi:hypothetical protein
METHLRRSVWPVILAGFAGSVLIGLWGRNLGWDPIPIFLAQAGFLILLAAIRRGVTRVFMAVLVVLQGIPVFGLGPVLLIAIPGFGVAWAVMWRIYIRKLGDTKLAPRNDQAVTEAARSYFHEWRHLGFQPAGAADVTGPGYETIFTYMIAPDRFTYAIVTDQVQTLVSCFGDRYLTTMDRGSLPTPPSELRQLVTGNAATMFEAHRSALDHLARRRLEADRLDSAHIVALSHQAEQVALAYISTRPWRTAARIVAAKIRRSLPDSQPIGDEPERIDRWMA